MNTSHACLCSVASRKQILNSATAAEYCRDGSAEWLLCNLDLDEAVCFSSGAEEHFGAVSGDISQIVYINHEANVADTDRSNGATWFDHIKHFKISPVVKLPFMCRRFPAHDEEPQVLDHPEGIGEKTLSFWQKHNARLSEQYNFKKRSGGSTCSYFDGYMRGKVAVRLNALGDAVPRVHRWHGRLHTVVCHPGAASILHYINCGGLDWFEAKYQIRGSEEANRLWFHVLAQERAKMGREALKELYDDVLSIPDADLQTQIAEGFVAPLALGSNTAAFEGFWGWAAVGLGDELCVHMPLHIPLGGAGAPDSRPLGQPMFHELGPGEYMEGDLHRENAEVPVFVAQIPVNERGFLVLDVAPTNALHDYGLVLCVARADSDRPDFESVSLVSPRFSGWRCRIQAHKWRSPTVAIWVISGIDPPEPCGHPLVSFEALSECYESSASRCRAHLRFEHESSLLPLELHAAYDIFHAAYKDVDGKAIADEAERPEESLELTYAEVEFAPFIDLFERLATPQPGAIPRV